MLAALATLFILTMISFAIVVMFMTLRDSWSKVLNAFGVEETARAPREIRVRRVQMSPTLVQRPFAGAVPA